MKYLNNLFIIFLLITAILICFIKSSVLIKIKEVLLDNYSPVIQFSHCITKSLGKINTDLVSLDDLEFRFKHLTAENRKLRTENNLLKVLQVENQRMRSLLNYQTSSTFNLLAATVIEHGSETWQNTIKINRGSNDGVKINMPIITELGLLGKTILVSKTMSEVLLINDEMCKVAAKVEGKNEQGIASGLRSTGEIQLTFISRFANLQVGQKIYTSGINGGVFPSGLLLGTVKSFQVRELDGFAILQPAVDLDHIDEVFVLKNNKSK